MTKKQILFVSKNENGYWPSGPYRRRSDIMTDHRWQLWTGLQLGNPWADSESVEKDLTIFFIIILNDSKLDLKEKKFNSDLRSTLIWNVVPKPSPFAAQAFKILQIESDLLLFLLFIVFFSTHLFESKLHYENRSFFVLMNVAGDKNRC